MSNRLVLALPSKGRIHEKAVDFFADATFKLKRDGAARGYTARLSGLDSAEVQLLSASEIAGALESGRVHVGVTGLDLLQERTGGLGDAIKIVLPLGFGRADVVVAVPQCRLDVDRMADLVDVSEALVGSEHAVFGLQPSSTM